MKAAALRLCLAAALLSFLLSAASLGLAEVNFWLGLALSNLFCLAGLSTVMLSLWVHWCCPPDPVEHGTGLCPE